MRHQLLVVSEKKTQMIKSALRQIGPQNSLCAQPTYRRNTCVQYGFIVFNIVGLYREHRTLDSAS